jgi:hypothetical protein
MSERDTTPRYTPAQVIIANRMRVFPVERVSAYPPMQHPLVCPLVEDCTAVELHTAAGSRWFGFDKAWIDSSLRMVVQGFDARDKVRRMWEVADVE